MGTVMASSVHIFCIFAKVEFRTESLVVCCSMMNMSSHALLEKKIPLPFDPSVWAKGDV